MTTRNEKLETKRNGKARRGHVNVHKWVVVLFYVDWTMHRTIIVDFVTNLLYAFGYPDDLWDLSSQRILGH